MKVIKKYDLIQKKYLPPVILLYGADLFSMEEFLENILKNIIITGVDGIDFENIDAEETSSSAMVNIANQLPMMSEKRIVVVKQFNKYFSDKRKKNNTTNSLIKYLQNPNETTILILLAHSNTKIDFTKPPYDLLKNHAIDFPIVYENQLPKWVINRFSSLKISITPEAAELIVSQTEPDLRSLANEVEKICLYHLGKKSINLDDVSNVFGNSRQNTVFELINSVATRNTNKSISIMSNILNTSSQELSIITLLRDFFIKLWKLLELQQQNLQKEELSKFIGLKSSFFLKDYLAATKFYSFEDINNAFIILAETDSKLKSTNANSKFIIESMLINICSPK